MARILCVDDEQSIVTLKCTILEAAGHEATPSTSAEDAIQKLEHNSYDAVVTDWRLGTANGRAVLQAAKTNSTMPVVVVSGYVSEAFQAPEPLADLYLEKPINPEELVTIVNELLKIGDKMHAGQERADHNGHEPGHAPPDNGTQPKATQAEAGHDTPGVEKRAG